MGSWAGVHFITRVVDEGRIAKHGLGPSRRDGQKGLGIILEAILEIVELAGVILVDDLDVAECGPEHGIPVDDPLTLVDQSLIEQGLEDMGHRPLHPGVEREPLAREIQGQSHRFPLGVDGVRILVLPLPGPLEEPLAPELVLVKTLGPDLLLHLRLSGDTRMVHRGQIEDIESLEPLVAGDDILLGRILSVTDMELPSHVGRRDNEREAGLLQRLRIPSRLEVSTIDPLLLPALLSLGEIEIALHIQLHEKPPMTVAGTLARGTTPLGGLPPSLAPLNAAVRPFPEGSGTTEAGLRPSFHHPGLSQRSAPDSLPFGAGGII